MCVTKKAAFHPEMHEHLKMSLRKHVPDYGLLFMCGSAYSEIEPFRRLPTKNSSIINDFNLTIWENVQIIQHNIQWNRRKYIRIVREPEMIMHEMAAIFHYNGISSIKYTIKHNCVSISAAIVYRTRVANDYQAR